MEMSALYSNIDPDSLVYKGERYDHLHKVNRRKVEELRALLNLKDAKLPADESINTIFSPHIDHSNKHVENEEEEQSLNSGKSKIFDGLGLSIAPSVSLEFPLGPAKLTLNLDQAIANVSMLGFKATKQAIDAWGGSRTRNVTDMEVLGQYLPILEPFIGLGKPISYKEYAYFSEGEVLITNPSTTFEFWTNTMPIFNVIVFCGRVIGASDTDAGGRIREGFVHGLLPPGPLVIGRKQAIHHLCDIVREIWIKGGSAKIIEPTWEKWSSQFFGLSQCKASVIRDLIRLVKMGKEIAFQVCDKHTAAVTFGLARLDLCKIMALDFGSGIRIYSEKEVKNSPTNFLEERPMKLESSAYQATFVTYRYADRFHMLRVCGAPDNSSDNLKAWIEKEIGNTVLLGIENGDPPGSVVMTPRFSLLSRTGAIKSLGEMVTQIATNVAALCEPCAGSCLSMINILAGAEHVGCRTVLFLNIVLTAYVGGVLKKAGMDVDQCVLAGDLQRIVRSLKALSGYDDFGLSTFLESWYILRSGEDEIDVDTGSVLGLEMDGQIHGIRSAVKPGTTGSPLVSFDGHMRFGSHTFARLVFTPASNLLFEVEEANYKIITELPPDVIPKPILCVRPEPNYIAVETFLVYPGGEQLQVDLGARTEINNTHDCSEYASNMMAIPMHVSKCANGCSVANIKTGFPYVLYAYGNEALQSWLYGLFPGAHVQFQGCRPIKVALALLPKEGGILIQGNRTMRSTMSLW